MSKNSYLVLVVEECGGFCAIVEKWNNCNNLCGLASDSRVKSINICDSKKDAEQIAENWNKSYKANGAYAFA